MKKIYYFAGAMLISGIAVAQGQAGMAMRAQTGAYMQEIRPLSNQDRAPGDVILTYEDDFSTPANWVVANTGSPAHDFSINTTGPASAPDLINSTSGGNFAWYDCDPQGDGSTVDATLTYGSTFDLTGYPAVMVSFEQFYMDYYEDTYVEVSTNGLTGPWTQYEVNADYTPNSYSSTNPVQTLVNISALAGNQSNVAVRFHYVGGWGWSWQIDDFALVEAYQHDLTISQAHFTSGTWLTEYYQIPSSQITEFTFGSYIKSNGVTTQTNTYMNVQVDGGVEYDEVSGQTTNLAENQIDSFSIETPNGWTPSGTGSYDLEMIAITDDFTDQLISDNIQSHEPITVGGTIYARDNGIISGGFAGFVSTAGEPLQIGNVFEFYGSATFGRVHIGLTTSANSDGQLAYASVYKWDDGAGDFVFVTQSEDYMIVTSDLGTILEFDLQSNVDAVAGDVFLVCGGHYGGDPTVSFAEAQNTIEETVLAQSVGGLIVAGDPSAMIIRVEFAPTQIGLTEQVAATGFTAYPNPANNQFTVEYNLVQEGNVSLVITDITGQVVLSEEFGSQTKGTYKSVISTDELANGVYFYTLNVDGTLMTKKMTVSKN